MQMKNRFKIPGNWKVIAGVGTAAVLGLAGIASAGSGDSSAVPAPITLHSQVQAGDTSPDTEWRFGLPGDTTSLTAALGATTQYSVDRANASYSMTNPSPDTYTTTRNASLDSPYTPPTTKVQRTTDISLDSPASPDAPVSTTTAKAAAPRDVSIDSPDSSPAPPPTTTRDYSADSVDKPDSLDSVDSSLNS